MELKELSSEITTAMLQQIETLHELRAEQRERWFETDDQGRKVEVYDTYIIDGREYEFPRIGLESPDKFTISKVSVKTNSDMQSEPDENGLKKLICGMHGHSNETSEVEVNVEFTRVEASEGMMALHKRAVREIKQACMLMNPEPTENEEGDTNG